MLDVSKIGCKLILAEIQNRILKKVASVNVKQKLALKMLYVA
jgi:hypothetical protein